jgi:hypothetical protein
VASTASRLAPYRSDRWLRCGGDDALGRQDRCKEQKKDDLIDTLEIGKKYETSTKASSDPD